MKIILTISDEVFNNCKNYPLIDDMYALWNKVAEIFEIGHFDYSLYWDDPMWRLDCFYHGIKVTEKVTVCPLSKIARKVCSYIEDMEYEFGSLDTVILE